MANKQVAAGAVIKDCKIKPECADLNFTGLQFTPSQYSQIAEWIRNNEPVIVVVSPKQADLFEQEPPEDSED